MPVSDANNRGVGRAVPLIGGTVLIAAAALAIALAPEESAIGRYRQRALLALDRLSQQARAAATLGQERLQRAREAFQTARQESERLLLSQLEESKQRGAVPPA